MSSPKYCKSIFTKSYYRIPSEAGVQLSLSGYGDIVIESRLPIEKRVNGFLRGSLDEVKPTALLIKGEWGEGKSDVYERYITKISKDLGFADLFITASTIAKLLKERNPPLLRIGSLPESKEFLVAVFIAYTIESSNATRCVKIPNYTSYNDPDKYLEEVLKNLSSNYRRAIVFVDELEALLNPRYRDVLTIFLDGLKEVINGQYRPSSEGGSYQGFIHFILAVTPDAYNKIESELARHETGGGILRRISKIDLPPVNKQEGIKFLWDLLKFSYNNELPLPLPIRSAGTLNTLYRVSLGNLGNMVSLFSKTLKHAKAQADEENKIKVVDSFDILTVLRAENITIYGGTTSALNSDVFDKIVKYLRSESKAKDLGEEAVKIFSLLLGELKPFSSEEIRECIKSHRKTSEVINHIIEVIERRLGIKNAIIRVCRIKEGIDIEEAIDEIFGPFMYGEERIIIDNFKCSKKELLERIMFPTINRDNLELTFEYYLPSRPKDVEEFFKGISSRKASSLSARIGRICEYEEKYILSETLLEQLYPTPVPPELIYISDRMKRLSLWREVSLNFNEHFRREFLDDIKEIINTHKDYSLVINTHRGINYVDVCLASFRSKDVYNANAILAAINGTVTSEFIKELYQHHIKNKPIHLVLIFFTQNLDEDVDDIIDLYGLEHQILFIKVSSNVAKRIFAVSNYRAEDEKSESLKKDEIFRILDDLQFSERINEWLDKQKQKGVYIEKILDVKELFSTLRFYINIGHEASPEEAFNFNSIILEFVRHGIRRRDAPPDIESLNKLRDLTERLKEQGFLENASGDKYIVKMTPIEERLIEILEELDDSKEYPLHDIAQFFLSKDPDRDKLRMMEAYVDLLESKGKIEKISQGGVIFVRKTNEEELYHNLMQYYRDMVNNKLTSDTLNDGVFLSFKKRQKRTINLKAFKDFLDKEVNKLTKNRDPARIKLILNIMKYVDEEWLSRLGEVRKQIKLIEDDVNEKCRLIENKIKDISNNYKKITNINLDIKNLDELKQLKKRKHEIIAYKNKSSEDIVLVADQQMDTELEEDLRRVFSYDRDPDEPPYFNFKLYLLLNLKGDFDQKYQFLDEVLENIEDILLNLINRRNRIILKIKGIEVPPDYIFTDFILSYLSNQLNIENKSSKNEPSISFKSLQELKKHIEETAKEEFNKRYERLENLVKLLEEKIKQNEEELLNSKNSIANKINKAKEIIDIPPYKENLDEINNKLEHVNKILNEIKIHFNNSTLLRKDDLLDWLSKLSREKEVMETDNVFELLNEVIKYIKETYKELDSEIDMIWKDFSSFMKKELERMETILGKLDINGPNYRKEVKEVLKSDISRLKRKLDFHNILELNVPFSKINDDFKEIKSRYRDFIRKVLTEKEVRLLDILLQEVSEEGITLADLLEKIEKRASEIDPRTLLEFLLKMMKYGIVHSEIKLLP